MEKRFGKRRCDIKAGKLVFLYVLLAMAFGPAPVSAAMTDLGTLGGTYSRAYAINKTGQVAGASLTSSEEMHPFLYSNGSMKDLGTFGGSGWSEAYDINDAGQVVGYSQTFLENDAAFLYA